MERQAMTISQRLEHIRVAGGRRALAGLMWDSLAKPMLSDMGQLRALHGRFRQACDPDNKDNAKIFVLIAVLCFSPAAFVGGRLPRGGMRAKIGEVLGVSGSAVSRHFADAKSLFEHHKPFHAEAERVFALMQEETKTPEHQQTEKNKT